MHVVGIVYASLHGNNNALAKPKSLIQILVENKKIIMYLKSLVHEGNLRFNLPKQVLRDEKHSSASISQSFKTYKLENSKCISDDCATNSTASSEAFILKENVELRAQLELLSSNY